jgi:nucleoside-diphosphate-sugar epimerase
MMKALLIGGTGNISASVTAKLLRAGWEVWHLNRGSRPAPAGVRTITGDINDEPATAKLLAGSCFDVVADFIAFVPAQVQRDVRLFAGKTGQYIFISSASAYQKPISGLPITESTPLANPYWQYSRDKIACEEALMAQYRSSGFPVTIVRPSHTYGPAAVPVAVHGKGGSWPVLRRMLQGKPIVIPGDGESLWALTTSDDFAGGFAGLAGNPHAIGEAVHITSDEILTWNAAHRAVAAALGVELRAVHVPSAVLAGAGKAYGYDFEGALIGDKANSVLFDNSKIKRLAPGFVAATRFDVGVRASVEYFLAHPELQKEDPDFDRFSDRMAAAMLAAEEAPV